MHRDLIDFALETVLKFSASINPGPEYSPEILYFPFCNK
jgi:hypothetical protein